MNTMPLLYRWSLRDLRERWMQVVGISVIIALGVAVFSGLGSATPWRTRQLDESYAILNMYDLKVSLSTTNYLDTQALLETVHSIPHADWLESVELRLALPTSVDASTPEQLLVVSGQIVGVEVAQGGPDINQLHLTAGRQLTASDAGQLVCILEHNFAKYYDLSPGERSIRVSGGYSLESVGNGISAEHFMVIEEAGGILGMLAQDRYAVIFMPLESAQQVAGLPDRANQVLVTAVDGLSEAELEQIKVEVDAAISKAFPQVAFDLEKVSENDMYRLLYDDIPGDQQMYDTFGFILLLGAAFGSFILIGRIVEAQRREIGINMALGVPPGRIARRYFLVGVQIAFLGTLFGVFLGLLINQWLGRLIGEMLPTPCFESPFQPAVFARAALIGIIIPFMAILPPIWRAVRVPPIEAIQTGYLVSKGGGMAPLIARSLLGWLPLSSFGQLPLRNLSRGLRRTLMTVLGLAMAIVVLVALVGMADTFRKTLDIGIQETGQNAPDRMLVLLDDFYPATEAPISEMAAHPQVAQVVPGVVLPGRLGARGESIDVVIQMLDLDNGLWSPTIVQGSSQPVGDLPGVLITGKAARDLGVGVGAHLTLYHLQHQGEHALKLVKSQVAVAGIHPDILRTAVYMDIRDSDMMNLDGLVNSLHIEPLTGIQPMELRQALSQIQGVTYARRALATTESVRSLIDDFLSVFVVIQVVVLIMAFLIAFNTTRSNIDERRRELATMFAFGTPVRTVIRMAVVENLIIGALGTLIGVALGWLLLTTMLAARFETMMPELNPTYHLAPLTCLLAVLFGVVVVGAMPVLAVRRLQRMDLPSTLRVME